MTYVPFTTSDACWCQPFDGPAHPECPMHGNLLSPAENAVIAKLAKGPADERTQAGNTNAMADENPEKLLEAAQDAQTAFWVALGLLEAALGVEIDGTADLSSATIETLQEDGE